jgi:hypothetical protein
MTIPLTTQQLRKQRVWLLLDHSPYHCTASSQIGCYTTIPLPTQHKCACSSPPPSTGAALAERVVRSGHDVGTGSSAPLCLRLAAGLLQPIHSLVTRLFGIVFQLKSDTFSIFSWHFSYRLLSFLLLAPV